MVKKVRQLPLLLSGLIFFALYVGSTRAPVDPGEESVQVWGTFVTLNGKALGSFYHNLFLTSDSLGFCRR